MSPPSLSLSLFFLLTHSVYLQHCHCFFAPVNNAVTMDTGRKSPLRRTGNGLPQLARNSGNCSSCCARNDGGGNLTQGHISPRHCSALLCSDSSTGEHQVAGKLLIMETVPPKDPIALVFWSHLLFTCCF